ncbi:ZN761 protein, partial [Leptocoma aspasia]|nr:ZN761 protein [Leptocoma aspasia]
ARKSCGECGKSFADPSALAKHRRDHEESQNSGNGKSLVESQKSGKSLEESQKTCSECGRTFGDPSALAKHRRLHDSGRNFG